MPKKQKEVEVIDMGGAKTVKKKTSFVTRTKRIFAVISVIWIVFVVWAPLWVKNTYSEPIKKSIVVSMFFDLQRNIVEQYEKLLDGIKDSIDLEKPVAFAIDKVRMAEDAVDKVTDTTAKAKDATQDVKETSDKAKKISGLAGMFGVDTSGVDKAIGAVDDTVNKANDTIDKVDETAKLVNQKLDKIETDLTSVLQVQIDDMIDTAIKSQLDKNSGGLGTTLLTNYGIKHVYPWRPSSWGVATKIYNDLEKSSLSTVTIITDTVNKYFGYVAWGLVIAFWALGVLLWIMAFRKVKAIIAPFIVCPRCGHTFTDRRTVYGLLKVLQPWKWF